MNSYNNILLTLIVVCMLLFCVIPVHAADTTTHEAFLSQNIIVKFKTNNTPLEIQQRIKTSSTFSLQGIWEKAFAFINTNIRKKTADKTLLQQFNELKTTSSFTYSPLFLSSDKDFTYYYLVKTKNYYSFSKTLPLLAKLEIVEYALPDSQVVIQKTNLGLEVNKTASDATPTPTVITLKKSPPPTVVPTKQDRQQGRLTVAVLDTGIETKSTVLSQYITPGFNILENSRNIQDENGHGTEISKIIISHLQPGQAQLLPIKNFDSTGVTTLSKIMQGLHKVYTLSQARENIRVINLSLAGPRLNKVGTQTYDSCKVYQDMAKKFSNTLFISAAGNDNTSTIPGKEYDGVAPAGCASFISVGAETKKGEKEDFSNKSGSDIYASGEGETIEGTSIAAAHISGTLAELLSNKPLLSSVQIIELLSKNKGKDSAPLAQLSLDQFIEKVKKLPQLTPTTVSSIGGANIINVIQNLTATQTPVPPSAGGPTKTPTPAPTAGNPTVTNTPAPSNTSTPPTLTNTPSSVPTNFPTLTNTPQPQPTTTSKPQPTNTPAPTPAPTNTSTPPTSTPIQCFESFELCDTTCHGRCEYSDVLCNPRNNRMYACH